MRFRERSTTQSRPAAASKITCNEVLPSSGVGLILEWTALIVAVATVCVLPWLLGGAIPKARLVLQVGTTAAAALTLLARLVSRRTFLMPPVGTWLLLGMAAVGIVQLQPWMPSAISRMNHSVHPEFRDHLPKTNTISATPQSGSQRSPADSGSVAPAMTRRHIAQWAAVALLLCIVSDSLTRSSQLIWILGLMCLNASLLTILSLLQLFNTGSRSLAELWIVSKTLPFGSFVNPNNASGWLLVHVAMAIGLVIVVWGRNPATGWSRSFQRPSWRDQIFETVTIIQHRIASLNNLQMLSIATVVLLLTGVAATLSRSGIVAGISCLFVCAASRMQLRKSLLLLMPMSILLGGVSIFLTAFELDTLVLAELTTLKDPVSESTSRLLHWSDSLVSIKDFPFLGSGQGGYAWSTLPYQRRNSTAWFMNADNQYVEILVESGLIGFALFAGFGILLTIQSMQLILNEGKTRNDKGLWTYRTALGMAGMAMMSSQAIVAFFDFGIGLSSTMAAIAVFGGILTAVQINRPALQSEPKPWFAMNGSIVGWSLRLALVATVYGSISELRQADKVYPAIVDSFRFLDSPVTRNSLERLPDLKEQLSSSLKQYPDNPVIWDLLASISEAQFRLRVIDELSPAGAKVDDNQLQIAWSQLTPLEFAQRIESLKKNLPPNDIQQLQEKIKAFSRVFPWQQIARQASRLMPLAPGNAVDAAAGAISAGNLDDVQLDELIAVRFTDPAGSRWLYQCGMACLIVRQPERAADFWKQSLQFSESYRVNILVNALQVWPPTEALEKFAPIEYGAIVRAAMAKPSPELEAGLWKLAVAQWPEVANTPTIDQRIQRANYLLRCETNESAIQWIDDCLLQFPETLELRHMRADILEKQGKLEEAIAEWVRYEYFNPKSSLPAVSIKRLIDAKNRL